MSLPRFPLRARLSLGRLEDRSTPATFTVTTAADSGAGSLRAAVEAANASDGLDNIVFAVGSGPLKISLASPLPAMTGPTVVLGNTQPGLTAPSNINPDYFFNAPLPLVTIDGTNAGAGADGLVFSGAGSSGSQVQYVEVVNFGGDGITFDNSSGGLLAYFVASGNGGNGVLITGAGAKSNRLQNGFIGVDATGNTVLPNGGDGVLIADQASGNVVGGGNFFQARCIISGNLGNGLRITGGASGNLEQGNVIGLNTGDNKAIGNKLDGVLVEGTGANNIIGGPIGLGGIKSGNGRHGVSIMGESPGTIVFNAFAGTSAFSNLSLGNGADGIHVEASGAGIIVTTNIASGNGRYGMYIGGNANGVVVNTFLGGVGFPGLFSIPNKAGGVVVTDNAKNTQFGTVTTPQAITDLFGAIPANGPQLRNILAGNGGPALVIEGNATGTRVINTNLGAGTGEVGTADAGPGLIVRGNATGTVVGTPDPAGRVLLMADPAGIVVETANPVTLSGDIQAYDLAGPATQVTGTAGNPPTVRLAAVTKSAAGLTASGSVQGTPNATVTVSLYAADGRGVGGSAESQKYLGDVSVTLDAAGVGRFQKVVSPDAGQKWVTAIGTGANGASSGFAVPVAVAPAPVVVTGADAGGGPQVNVIDSQTRTLTRSFFAYDPSFTGGVRVATADVNGDGVNDYVTAPGAGGGPHVRVFDGATGLPVPGTVGSFFAYDAAFTGGLFVAAGDVDGDGYADIITGPDVGGGPNVKVFSGATGELLSSFFAFDQAFTGGVRVGAGDLDGDGRAEVLAGTGAGGPATVRAFSGTAATQVANYLPFGTAFTGGLFLAAGDLGGVGLEQVIVGQGGGGSEVAWFDQSGTKLGSATPFGGFTGGARVGSLSGGRDGRQGILAAAGPDGGPRLVALSADPVTEVASALVYDAAFRGGVFVGGA